jgi:DNA-binding LacI/PurR family transcriptional regulator
MTGKHRASLKRLAEHLGLHPATVSVVLNEVPGRTIPQATRDRVKAAAKKFNYQPSLLARSLRNRQNLSIGILVPDLGEAYHNQIVGGIGDHLMESGYFYFTAHHRRKKHLVACRRVTITRLLASKLSWLLAAKSCSPSNSVLI